MKIQLMSDLHLECHRDKGREFLKSVEPAADVLVLAGDVASARFPDQLAHVFTTMLKKFKHVLYVPGNHEFYQTNLSRGWRSIMRAAELADMAVRGRVHVFDNYFFTVEDAVFYGGTGWFPEDDSEEARAARPYMNDFQLISGISDVYWSHRHFLRGLEQGPRPDVIVSHHLPSEDCVDLRYKGNPLNRFFVMGADVAKCGAKLWLHGHTHEQVDKTVGGVRVVCNPLGYPNEGRNQTAFQPKLVVEI